MPDLLVELFSEEIPARMQRKAADDLRRLMTDGLVEAGLTYAGAVAHCTPRRLALSVQGLTDGSARSVEERRGPKVGAPEKAVEGFLRSTGLSRDDLEVRADKKGEVYLARIVREGRPAAEIVAEVLEATVRGFPWPKSMRWGEGTLRWVRPLRRILCVITREDGAEVVPVDVDGIVAGDVTEGHRFMAPEVFSVTSFDDYEAKLKRANVVLSSEERAEAIRQDAGTLAFAAGLEIVPDEGLLAEVAGLVEWPVVLIGEIGEAFLGLPPEVLQTSMREHQKFFSARGKDGRITHFVTVANRETADDGATILDGNARVLAARLADAKFFWENDLRVATAGGEDWATPWLEALGNVTFHAKLGSQAERIERIAALARELAPSVGADPDLAERAARLAKADLSSEMVYEFPELQGLMGRYYAEAAGEDPALAAAAEQHYAPLGPSDDVPTAPVSVAVALADKLDTLAGFWAINEKPTGSKDPYALRRAALGVARLVCHNHLRFRLGETLSRHLGQIYSGGYATAVVETGGANELLVTLYEQLGESVFQPWFNRWSDVLKVQKYGDFQGFYLAGLRISDLEDEICASILAFLHDRLKVHLRGEGIRHDVIDACLTGERTDDLADLVARARALNGFLGTQDGENLVQGYKRAKNILTQAEAADGVEYSYGADPKLAEMDEERALFGALEAARPRIDGAMETEDYAGAMAALAELRAPIDGFFEAVQVNADQAITRRNRLNLLAEIVQACERIAALDRLEG
jgi:glycyl-tRNA synthetase beta chain